jgi:hypothetical protein
MKISPQQHPLFKPGINQPNKDLIAQVDVPWSVKPKVGFTALMG